MGLLGKFQHKQMDILSGLKQWGDKSINPTRFRDYWPIASIVPSTKKSAAFQLMAISLVE